METKRKKKSSKLSSMCCEGVETSRLPFLLTSACLSCLPLPSVPSLVVFVDVISETSFFS